MKLVFATHNQGKLIEVQRLLSKNIELVSLDDIGCREDIPENGLTLEENALAKAQHVKDKYGLDCFADDTGLLTDALGGAPGVWSARYAGPERDPLQNMNKLLQELQGVSNRSARFQTAIALILEGRTHFFSGVAEGTIIETARGNKGFGYDPIFLPEGETRTFAEMTLAEKNLISHRGKALKKLSKFLSKMDQG
ncbi:non-canonical purine NTP diphosphatase [Lentiprolixibacter aurantiacus]|uniref:dITP/XTP pyrophosphatase n=1 Tax=Lentiprolixibacter aurantiacus TaxID=2993939 RepID=A0AAE3MN04_9FLAO|nr:non-canonical purine NTP diphosphatase [Lentiprolixibacter aurantiacus]MCX2720203.1 non-canonical purine NTP diphosphatase [Lentiprolixibacter aurantiacus]